MDKNLKSLIKKLDLTLNRVVLRAFSAWTFLNLFLMLLTDKPDSVKFVSVTYQSDIGLLTYLISLLSSFLFLTVLDAVSRGISTDAWVLLLSVIGLSLKSAEQNASFYYAVFLLASVSVAIGYLTLSDKLTVPSFLRLEGAPMSHIVKTEKGRETLSRVLSVIAVTLSFGFFVYYVGTIGVLRYRTYSSPNFDFGIFVNMFHNMKETGLPLVTCERDKLLSHFAVHISPIYYLILPFYVLFPTPETVQLSQAIVLASGVIPLFLLCRKYGLLRYQSVLALIAYVCLPALSSGTFYDFHENCFLTPLLLFVFYFYESKKPIPMYIFAVLTLGVKEDAAIYIAFFALYILLGRERKRHGAVLLILSGAYIIGAITLLERFGDGAMLGRFSNYMVGDSGFVGIIATCLKNPLYIFTQMSVSGTDGKTIAAKLLYILQMLVPLGFVPLMTKKVSRFILIGPFILMNLMPLYPYQYDLGFQYNFGSAAFLLFLFVMNVSDMERPKRNFALTFSALAAAVIFTVYCVPGFELYSKAWVEKREEYETLDSILEEVDPDASLTVSTMLLPHVADRDVIYEVHYHDITSENADFTDYVVIDMRVGSGYEFYNKYMDTGKYSDYMDYPGYVRILIRTDLINIGG